jgi:hypothetical protein
MYREDIIHPSNAVKKGRVSKVRVIPEDISLTFEKTPWNCHLRFLGKDLFGTARLSTIFTS